MNLFTLVFTTQRYASVAIYAVNNVTQQTQLTLFQLKHLLKTAKTVLAISSECFIVL